MKRFAAMCMVGVTMVCMVGMAVLQTGCEEAKGLSGLEINPSSVMLSTNGATVVLSVVGGVTNNALALPLEWRVTDPDLGQITFSSGMTAVYRRSALNGVNTVIAKDQFSNEGYATIRQQAAGYGLTLEADATTIQPNQGTTVRIAGDEGQAPFSWSLAAGPGSLSASSGSRSAAYSAGSQTGVAVITVTDANGASGSISITVQSTTTNGNGGPGGGGPGGA